MRVRGSHQRLLGSPCPRKMTEQCTSPLTACMFLSGTSTFMGAVESEGPVCPEGEAASRRVTGPCPSSAEVHLRAPGQGGRLASDSLLGKCALSSCVKTNQGAQGPAPSPHSPLLPKTHTHTLKEHHQPSPLRGHDMRNQEGGNY